MSILEVLAAVCGLLAVQLMIVRNVWGWPVGLIQVLLYTKVFYDARLYSQTILQIVFAILQLQGWWQWHRSLQAVPGESAGGSGQVSVQRLTTGQWFVTIASATGISLLLGLLMQRYTDASGPSRMRPLRTKPGRAVVADQSQSGELAAVDHCQRAKHHRLQLARFVANRGSLRGFPGHGHTRSVCLVAAIEMRYLSFIFCQIA